MTKDEIIEYLWQIIDDIDTTSDMAREDNEVYRKRVERLQNKRWNTGITIDKDGQKLILPLENEWISVEDRLPEEKDFVLGYDAVGKQVRYMRYLDVAMWQMGHFAISEVTHWMRLPKPPKE